MYAKKQPAVWNKVNEHFSISEGGAIKPDSEGFDGRVAYLNLETAEHILSNLDSFRKTVETLKEQKMKSLISKELTKMRVNFIKSGLTPEQAEAAVQAILANKKVS
jgi:hypothetical protein